MPPVVAILLTLALAAAGGTLFHALHLPLAWMLGAMVFTTIAAFLRVPVKVPLRLRTVMITVLGVMLGSAFSPSLLDAAGSWLPAAGILVVFIVLVIAVVFAWFRHVGGYDTVTAYFSATPGGLSEMTLISESLGGDMRVVSLVHGFRILLVVFLVPILFSIFADYHVPSIPPGAIGLMELPVGDGLILAACAILGLPLGRLLRLPAYGLTGPLILSGAAHLLGFSASRPPIELVASAQVVVGAAIGSRFAGLAFSQVLRALSLSLGSSLFMIGMAGGAALIAAPLTGLPAASLMLALTPGGLAEMGLIALGIGLDTAFVSTMHVLRIALIVALAPLAFRLARRLARS